MNEIQQHTMITQLIITAIFSQTFSMFMLVRIQKHFENIILIFIFAWVFSMGFTILLILIGLMAQVSIHEEQRIRMFKGYICEEYCAGKWVRYKQKLL